MSKVQDEFHLLLLDSFHQGVIAKDRYEALLLKYAIITILYSLPKKMHKDLVYPPGRPIISGNSAYTEQASQLVNTYLCSHVMSLPSYVQDTQRIFCDV